jgi:hypothetical protein
MPPGLPKPATSAGASSTAEHTVTRSAIQEACCVRRTMWILDGKWVEPAAMKHPGG